MMDISTNPFTQVNMMLSACSNGDHHHQHHHHQQQQQQQQQHHHVQQQEQQQEKKPRPQQEQALKCPRCDSINTKFCYYNNYSLSQPRYFCKGCRRYWTHGGSLRNVPVGGGCRKNKRSNSSSSSSSNSSSSSSPSSSSSSSSTSSSPSSSSTITTTTTTTTLAPPHPPPFYDSFLLQNQNPNPNPNPSHGFLDILSGGANVNAGHHNFYFGNVQDMDMVVPFEGGFINPCKNSFDHGQDNNNSINNNNNNNNKVLMGLPWQFNGDVSMGFDYASWHGLINTSLM